MPDCGMTTSASQAPGAEPTFERAGRADVPAIVALLADDVLGATRENPQEADLEPYFTAFADIQADPNQFLCVARLGGEVAGTLQLSFIPGLSRGGAKRGQIEAVRVASSRRGHGLGEKLITWAVEKCRERGCSLVQLTTDVRRDDAHRFYERLGFSASHTGFKLEL